MGLNIIRWENLKKQYLVGSDACYMNIKAKNIKQTVKTRSIESLCCFDLKYLFKFWKKGMKKWMEDVLKISSIFVISVTLIWGQPLRCISTVSFSYLSPTLIGQKSCRLVKIIDLYDFTCIQVHALSMMRIMCSITHSIMNVSF